MDCYAFSNFKLHPIQQIMYVIQTLHLTDSGKSPSSNLTIHFYPYLDNSISNAIFAKT